VNGPSSGIYIQLHSVHTAGTMVSGNPTISARELSIPRNAHEDMEKGLAKLNGKSDYQGSIKDFERAIQEYPDYHEAYAQMGIAYLHLKNNASSEQALRKSLELSQNQDVDALIWLATLLSNTNRFTDAEPLARKAVELNPDSWQANSELAQALLGLNRFEEAEKSAQAAVKLKPDNPLLYLIEANIHEQLQDPALLDDLNNYLKLAPNGPFASQVRKQKEQVEQELSNAQGSPAPATPADK
jgi:tetratricopeptide (TPR) repeat protein